MLAWLVKDLGIATHIPVFDKSKRDDGTFSRADFQWQEDNNVYDARRERRLSHRAA